MSEEPPRPRPRAFRLDDERIAVDDAPAPARPTAVIRTETSHFEERSRAGALDEEELGIEAAQAAGLKRRPRLNATTLILSGLGGLISLAFGLWITSLIEALFAKTEALGWVGAAFLVVLALGVIVLGVREAMALGRQRRIVDLHAALARARADDDRDAARVAVARLVALYAARPETAKARGEIQAAMRAIVDGRDLIDVAERALLKPLDARAQTEIAKAAKRVSVVTAISPRAILDLVFVIAQIVRLCRTISEIYGGRPGWFGFLRLARSIAAHLTITGGMAVGDSLLQQVVGHGIASKISARMGEGVLNGLLTARVGLSALSVCRPAPFGVKPAPGVSEVAPFLFGGGKGA
jgi:putative membrane protein